MAAPKKPFLKHPDAIVWVPLDFTAADPADDPIDYTATPTLYAKPNGLTLNRYRANASAHQVEVLVGGGTSPFAYALYGEMPTQSGEQWIVAYTIIRAFGDAAPNPPPVVPEDGADTTLLIAGSALTVGGQTITLA